MNLFIHKEVYMHRTKKKTTEEFVNEARTIHGNKYDYSKTVYVNQLTEVCIICPIHGEFWQKPKNHLKGNGCQKCKIDKSHRKREHYILKFAGRRKIKDTKDFGEYYNKLYNRNYDFSNGIYVNKDSILNIICPLHGDFRMKASYLLYDGRYCPKCSMEHKKECFSSTQKEFIDKAKNIHGNERYDYSLTEYINNKTKVKIICHEKDINGEEHGIFNQTPANHLKYRGCPKCKEDKLVYENKLYVHLCEIFDKGDIIRQYRNKDSFGNLSLDFYIPKYKIAIEHQGSQHFRPLNYFGGIEKFNITYKNDREKEKICQNNGITLLYFTYEKYVVSDYYKDKIYTDIILFKDKLREIKEQWEK
jgi:very-short-patch-repair endonuclease